MIIISIITVTSSKDSNGQSDSAWLNYWTSVEASIAVMTISVGAFRSLFTSNKSNDRNRPSLWRWPNSQPKTGPIRQPIVHLPTMPSATLTGMRTLIWDGPLNRSELHSQATTFHGMNLFTDEPSIRVTHDNSTLHVSKQPFNPLRDLYLLSKSTEINRDSYEHLV